ncbi:MAG: 30S ribosomal protein S4e [Candidatus Aenigmarchaeota archaeon]|nr:30S ribosomal protein S4e [Candidatus Aenigmarchaeota archaeon]
MVRVKRISAPQTFPTTRKAGGRFAPTPRPGPHAKKECAPLGSVVRDALGLAETMREVREALNAQKVTVNNIVRRDTRFPVGIFDVVGVGGEHFRAIPSSKGFAFVSITKKESDMRLVKIENKTLVRGGRVQLNMNDGTNVLTENKEYSTGDTLVMKMPDLKVASHLKMAKGALVMLTRGRNVGRCATLEAVNTVRGTGINTATLAMGEEKIQVPADIIFVIGEKESVVKIA